MSLVYSVSLRQGDDAGGKEGQLDRRYGLARC